MGCANTGPFVGGVYQENTLLNPVISGGEASGTTLKNGALNGALVIDEAAAKSILDSICDKVSACVTFPEEEAAAIFKDCDGAPHQPGNQIPTCTQMKQYVAGVLTPTVSTSVPTTTAADAGGNMLPTTIVGDKRDSLLGTPAAYIEVGDYIIPAYKKKV